MTTLSAPKPTKPALQTPPTLHGRFPFGNLPAFRKNPLGFLLEVGRLGDVVRMRFGPGFNYQINHPDGVQHVLQLNNRNYIREPFGNNLIKLISGLNLFSSDGDYWLQQRRLMQPAFHRRRIATFGKVMTEATLRMIQRWQPAIREGRYLDMHQEMMRLTMEVVGQALFSVDLSDDTSLLGRSLITSTEYINYRFNNPIYAPTWIPTRRNRALKKAIADINATMQTMIDDRRRSGEQKDDLMAMLMEARDEDTGEGMTDEQLRSELAVMIAAGQETTSNALTWVFYLLSEYPDVEERLHAELDTVLEGRLPTLSDLQELPYLSTVLDETMRLYPPAWAVASRRSLAEDEIIGYRIPAHATVMMFPYVIHRDERFWPEPEVFRPERFDAGTENERHRFAYLPFGGGPRKCIGNLFALMEAKLILAILLQRYRLRTKAGYAVEADPIFTLRVKDGLPMRVLAR